MHLLITQVFLGSDDEEEEGRADEAEAPAAFPASDPANVRITGETQTLTLTQGAWRPFYLS